MHATIFDVFLNVCKKFQDRPAYIYRAGDEELTVTYGKFKEDVLLLSKAFRQRKVTKGSHVFLLSDNRYSWIVTDMALQSLGAVSVPRGSDTPTSELEYILEHSECSFLIVETEALLEQHNALIKKSKLKSVFVITGPEQHRRCPAHRQTAPGAGDLVTPGASSMRCADVAGIKRAECPSVAIPRSGDGPCSPVCPGLGPGFRHFAAPTPAHRGHSCRARRRRDRTGTPVSPLRCR